LNAQFPKQSKYSAANKLSIAKQALSGRPNAKPEHQAQPSTVLLLQFNIYSKMQKLGARQYSTSTFRRDEGLALEAATELDNYPCTGGDISGGGRRA
jgi:hypothetical protein